MNETLKLHIANLDIYYLGTSVSYSEYILYPLDYFVKQLLDILKLDLDLKKERESAYLSWKAQTGSCTELPTRDAEKSYFGVA
jgi:hypothetical protein